MTLMWFDSFRELDLPGVGPDDIDLALERNVLASSDRSSEAPDVVARTVPACPGRPQPRRPSRPRLIRE